MRLYHRSLSTRMLMALPLAGLLLAACTTTEQQVERVDVSVTADGKTVLVQAPAGSTVEQVLEIASITADEADRIDPPPYTTVADGDDVTLVRVREEFEVVQETLPFERQILKNESLTEDNEIYLQKGKNGIQEVTTRNVYEDGVLVSEGVVVSRVTVEEPVPEIVMIGIQAPFFPVDIPGRLVYLRDGNPWLIEENTGDRRALLTTGDLDGRVFTLSEDGSWLLFTRHPQEEGGINDLWVLEVDGGEEPIDLQVQNVVHFADFLPDDNSKVVFSTVEPRSTAPGWQANNDLYVLSFSTTGWTSNWEDKPILEANAGGVYGWWGTSFAWAPDPEHLAYARPDGVGIVKFNEGTQEPLLDMIPLQTGGDWAWVPGISWAPDGSLLYSVNHLAPQGSASPEESPLFALAAVPVEGGPAPELVSQAGMFAYPLASPLAPTPTDENAFFLVYLQAVFPTQSETSRYQVVVMDRDGSNRRTLFPGEERTGGLEPGRNWGAWSPEAMPGSGNLALALLYQGNLWLVDAFDGKAQQVTGDGLTTRVVWK